ncbi:MULTISPECIES: MerR family transcriptional regulator [Planococcus]|uniref:MerR family transcriptional regulator n=2 Tax=Planococcus TaxID=1372 RepID=A0ABM5WZ41_9BACL|nr:MULTISPECIES: MerR family transcriptional regulator [Planococcus]ALS79633.1 MerR family transcriptional regulator [Planococcus kocurii]AQU78396.1 MerR family transcriptional regulator [Planococcus faecalis]KAA0955269.1 MerR family transcriptional regulator [Planococcus sp. ANT_H30]MDJ0331800.1 MerR family transcriptional regulator [Planococcus sp. S3-L1]OHX52404.1 MerR family transcriptional regulator [Planococcus faecalis]
MKIGEIAKLSGVSTRTIDYYTVSGLLQSQRTKTNYRLYPASSLQTLKRIQVLKKQRLSISEIKDVLATQETSETTLLVDEVYEEFECLQRKITRLEEQLKDAPSPVKLHISKALEHQLAAITALIALL